MTAGQGRYTLALSHYERYHLPCSSNWVSQYQAHDED